MLVQHGDAKHANHRHAVREEEGDFAAPKPVAAFQHAVDAGDVFRHALSTFSNYYGRHRYLALELSQRDSALTQAHSQPGTPLPPSDLSTRGNMPSLSP